MAERADWLVPYFNGEPRLTKPPLSYWATGGAAWIDGTPASSHLFLLSRQSRAVVEFTQDGKEIGRFSLKAVSAGLRHQFGSPEGITITPDGRLFICSEPNSLYEFTPPAARRSA